MKTGRSTEYGMIAVCHIAQHYKDGPVMAQKVARAYDIPLEYLLKILQQMVRENVLISKRGPRGGFWLSRDASEITLVQVVEAIEGPVVTNMQLAQQAKNVPFSVRIEKVCRNISEGVRDAYGKVSIAEMIAE
ncbi:MAG: Rrf2 family transcriptional regulator [Planctomycetes bacterium]|nr:Rrf2 family transcriptional regulator [Planctomycetota bacterium]